MTSTRSRRRRHAMAQKIAAFVLAFMVPIVAADSAPLASRSAESPKASKIADTRTGSPDNAPSQQQPAAAPEAALPDATEAEISRRFNDLRRELLDGRTKTVDWWLTAMAIFLALFGLIAGYLGIIGFNRFRKIETEARENVESSRKHAEEARNLVDEIKAQLDEAEAQVARMKKLTAEIVHNEPNETRRAAESVQKNPAASPIDRAIAAAALLQREDKIKEAIEKWQAIANIVDGIDTEKETGARAWFSIGYLRQEHKEGTHEKAIDAYGESIRLKPGYPEAYNNRGVAKNNLGRHEEALADYDAAIRLKPDYAEAYNNRGIAKDDLGRHEEALADYDTALRLTPDDAEIYNNRGVAKDNLGRHEEAIVDYDAALRLNPDSAAAYHNRGNAKKNLGRHKEALADCDEALRLNPDNAKAYYNRGNVNASLNRMADARHDFGTAISLARSAGEETLASRAERALEELSGEQGGP